MKQIVICPYCHNEFDFKYVGEISRISYIIKDIGTRCPKCKGWFKYYKGKNYELGVWD